MRTNPQDKRGKALFEVFILRQSVCSFSITFSTTFTLYHGENKTDGQEVHWQGNSDWQCQESKNKIEKGTARVRSEVGDSGPDFCRAEDWEAPTPPPGSFQIGLQTYVHIVISVYNIIAMYSTVH